MKQFLVQEFYVRVATERAVTGTQLLEATLGLKALPGEVHSIEFGDVENSPAVWEHALRCFAERRGWRIVDEVTA